MTDHPPATFGCPLPSSQEDVVTLAHGGGGALMHRIVDRLLVPTFADPALAEQLDGAVLDLDGVRLAFTTDGYVVSPPFFPGGDIGTLAVHGTVNDLAMCGARPLHLSVALVLEEGFAMADLERVVRSLKDAADGAGVRLVTGDTKVVERGKGDGIFITTAGIGRVETPFVPAPARLRPGDTILISGDVGRHGMAVMAAREGITFETTLESDTAPLWPLVEALCAARIDIRCLRDPTRGGLATSLVEIARAANAAIDIDEVAVPVLPEVVGACEVLGLDPLYVANEGCAVICVPGDQADAALEALRAVPVGRRSAVIGSVRATGLARGAVTAHGPIGADRVLDMLSGAQLPRIC